MNLKSHGEMNQLFVVVYKDTGMTVLTMLHNVITKRQLFGVNKHPSAESKLTNTRAGTWPSIVKESCIADQLVVRVHYTLSQLSSHQTCERQDVENDMQILYNNAFCYPQPSQ